MYENNYTTLRQHLGTMHTAKAGILAKCGLTKTEILTMLVQQLTHDNAVIICLFRGWPAKNTCWRADREVGMK